LVNWERRREHNLGARSSIFWIEKIDATIASNVQTKVIFRTVQWPDSRLSGHYTTLAYVSECKIANALIEVG
jgi:hypothetical protein